MAQGFISAQGDRSTAGALQDSIGVNFIIGSKYTTDAGGVGAFTVTELGVYCDNSGGSGGDATFAMAIYEVDGDGDLDNKIGDTLLANEGEHQEAPSSADWVEFTGLDITVNGSTEYAIVVWTDDGLFDFEGVANPGDTSSEYASGQTGQYSWPDIAGGSTARGRSCSLYAVYESAGSTSVEIFRRRIEGY